MKSNRDVSAENLFYEVNPVCRMEELILSDVVAVECREFIEEQHKLGLLRAKNLEPRHRILLVGPPGNGKSLLAEAIASELAVELLIIRYESIMTDSFGAPSSRLSRLFDQVKTRRCVLFFDEFDIIARERDIHERSIVGALVFQIDDLPSHVVIIAATNHPELLDRGVDRRFQVKLNLSTPNQKQIEDYLRRFEDRTGEKFVVSVAALAKQLEGASFSEIEQFCLDIRRRSIMSPDWDKPRIIKKRLKRWMERFGHGADSGAGGTDLFKMIKL